VARNILIVTVLLLWYGLPAGAQTGGCEAIADPAEISEVGAFSNMSYTEEHAYGYSVMLWGAGDCLFGLFESSQGLAGDTPVGELQDVTYDRKTGHLSFSAKLTTGMVSCRGSNGEEPSRNLFAFDGNLKATTVTGALTYTLQNNPNVTPTHTDVVLRVSKTAAEFMRGSTAYGEWLRTWQPIRQHRGPKW
jgi:hypothetical protein